MVLKSDQWHFENSLALPGGCASFALRAWSHAPQSCRAGPPTAAGSCLGAPGMEEGKRRREGLKPGEYTKPSLLSAASGGSWGSVLAKRCLLPQEKVYLTEY